LGRTKNLINAKKNKYDDFYTQRDDIDNELNNYIEYFENKIIYCNCDDPEMSNFWFYFKDNFKNFKIKTLISTHYDKNGSYKLEYDGNETKTVLQGNGDFRSQECVDILKTSDIIITNPPFSLFGDFVKLLFKYDKKFLIIGTLTAATKPYIFEKIVQDDIGLGYGFKHGNAFFKSIHPTENYTETVYDPETGLVKFRNIIWLQNLKKINQKKVIIDEVYNSENYDFFDNSDILNVNAVKKIPKDYKGLMGVPITFLTKYNREQFEILGIVKNTSINGKSKYIRILIKYR